MKNIVFLFLIFSTSACATTYPKSWWKPAPESERRSWEFLPQDAKKGEVILSKRNELGIFSNLAKSPFYFEGENYISIESLWQMMKYPERENPNDIRNNWSGYNYTREEVKSLYGFESKKAGDQANKLMKDHKIKWVSYKGKRFNYKDLKSGSKYHYKICLLYTSPSPRDQRGSRMPSSA